MSPRILDDSELNAREQRIMEAALAIMSEHGVAGLTIDKVVACVPYSKGTVYNHFSCKEDLLTGLCNRCLSLLQEMFQRAADFPGNSREKMFAVGYAYLLHSLLHPTEFMLVISAKTPSVREKSSQQRCEHSTQLEDGLLNTILKIISAGLASGDLSLQPHLSPAQVAFSLWALGFGTIALLHESLARGTAREEMQIERELVNHSNLMLDGLQWQPYTADFDWQATVVKLKTETFKREMTALTQTLAQQTQSKI